MPTPQSSKFIVLASLGLALLTAPGHSQTLYAFGNPTSEEQMYIEYINRARANPTAEGIRLATTTDTDVTSNYTYFGVDLNLMKSEFAAIPVTPPLAPHTSLTTSARGHSQWMLNNATQAHDETNPYNDPWTRMNNAGYSYSNAGENIYAYVKTVWHGHAGFQVDWGTDTGGMQDPRGHRESIHNSDFREIGVGVVNGTNGTVGPQLVTQDFGTRSPSLNLGTGVAYYDMNSNDFYDVGEGISGLTVNVNGASYYCTTAAGGGWVVPCPTNATTRTVTFSGLNVNQTKSIVFPASKNAKTDLKLTYSPPTINSSATVASGSSHNLTFTAVGGASGYTWTRSTMSAAAAENCNSTANITSSTTGTYTVLNTSVKYEGTGAFHLENSTAASQSLQLGGLYYGQASPSISFQSRVRNSTTSERFKVQVKQEGSAVWQDVYDQLGGTSDAAFTLRSTALTGMAGKAFRVRFLLNFSGSSYYNYSGDSFGWFIDAISFTGVSSLGGSVSQTLAGTSGSFTPASGTYLMSVSPVISGRDFPAAYQTLIVSAAPPPSFLTWAAGLETTHSLASGAISNPNLDQDKDGKSNLIEYAFGCSPITGNDSVSRMPSAPANPTYYVIRYLRDTSLTDLTFTPQASSSLGNWKAPGESGAPAGFTDVLVSTAGTIQTREARIPKSTAGNWFMRVKVSQQ